MAHMRQLASGAWNAQVRIAGHPTRSITCDSKAELRAAVAKVEASIRSEASQAWPTRTVKDAFERYIAEVSPTKRGERWEVTRLRSFLREHKVLAERIISEVATPDIAIWRDARLKQVTRGTVLREINLLRNVWTVARKEWQWTGESPFTALRMPQDNPSRDRLITWREAKAICRALGYVTGRPPLSKTQQIAYLFLLALRSGMRAGELLSLNTTSVDLQRGVATLSVHKTLEHTGKPRLVPLLPPAVRLLRRLLEIERADDGLGGGMPLWTVSDQVRATLFRRALGKRMVDDVHFHDSRATALTHLARRVDVITLAKISGHSDLNLLLNTYYRESEADIAKRVSASYRTSRTA